MSEKSDSENLLTKWLAGEISDEEMTKLRVSEEFKDYENIINELDTWEVKPLNTFDAYGRLKGKLKGNRREEPTVVALNSRKWFIGIAAALTLLVTFYFVFNPFGSSTSYETYATNYGEQKKVTLPDGSVATLNGKSSIKFDKQNWSDDRVVTIDGNVYFDVNKGKKFQVNFEMGKVEVLGTRFDVLEGEFYFQVNCYEGVVSVADNTGESAGKLTAGKGVRYSTLESFEWYKLGTGEPTWVKSTDKWIFKSTPMYEVMNVVGRHYGVTFKSEDIDTKQRITGQISTKDLDLVMEALTNAIDCSYKKEGDMITFTKE